MQESIPTLVFVPLGGAPQINVIAVNVETNAFGCIKQRNKSKDWDHRYNSTSGKYHDYFLMPLSLNLGYSLFETTWNFTRLVYTTFLMSKKNVVY